MVGDKHKDHIDTGDNHEYFFKLITRIRGHYKEEENKNNFDNGDFGFQLATRAEQLKILIYQRGSYWRPNIKLVCVQIQIGCSQAPDS